MVEPDIRRARSARAGRVRYRCQSRTAEAAIRPACSSARRRSPALMTRSAWYWRPMSYTIIAITPSRSLSAFYLDDERTRPRWTAATAEYAKV